MKKVLVLCTANSCRSQLAEGYLRYFAGDKAEIYSAGVRSTGVNPGAIATMKEDGIDISSHTSNAMEEYKDIDFDYVITVCDNARENCPFWPGKSVHLHHAFPDPAHVTGTDEEVRKAFATTRDMIKEYSRKFVAEYL
ncbi:MAG: arsenate reductase ArsC [Chitinophagia bacterium]|jgi:arsenate reductase